MSTDVYADLTLSHDGVDIALKADGSRIDVVFPSVRQGIRSIRSLLEQRDNLKWLESTNSTLATMGLSVYFKAGPIAAPVLGVDAHRRLLPALKDVLTKYAILKGR